MEPTESMNLSEAAGVYVGSIKSKERQDETHRELYRFVHWCGTGRTISGLSPVEIAGYADHVGGSGTTPQAAERLQVVKAFLSYAKKKGIIDKSLAQHVRIPKSKARRGAMAGRNAEEVPELTRSGHAKLKAQLEKLKAERVPLAQDISKAAADKDVRENAPLEAAREQLGLVESRIRDIENTLESAVIIDSSSSKRATTVKVGTRVSVKDLGTGRENSYTLVSAWEAKPLEGLISDVSPLGQAINGRSVGQEVEAKTPRGNARYRILKVTS